MNETSLSFLSIKNNPSSQPWNYKIISINKDQKTNQHSIRIGIDEDQCNTSDDSGCKCEPTFQGRIPYEINSTSLNKVSVKMKSTGQGSSASNRFFRSSSRKSSTEDSNEHSHDRQSSTENVEAEPCKKVSTAKALFENMSSSSSKESSKNRKARSQLKSWNSSSLLDNCEESSSNKTVKVVHLHSHSKSLPAEITDVDYGNTDCTVQSTSQTTYIASTAHERSAVGTRDEERNFQSTIRTTVDVVDTNNNTKNSSSASANSTIDSSNRSSIDNIPSGAGIFTSSPNNNVFHRPTVSEIICTSESEFDQEMSVSPSYSSEDLRHETRGRPPSASTISSANELRMATSRYHQHLTKMNPRLRNTIAGKDNKFSSRKTSLPVEEEHDCSRTSISPTTTTVPKVRHSFSTTTNENVGINNLNDMLLNTNDNSIMSRLLRDNNNTATLMTIGNEIKDASATVNNVKVCIRRNSSDMPKSPDLSEHMSDKICSSKEATITSRSCSSIDNSGDPENTELHYPTDSHRPHRPYSGAKSTGSILPEMNFTSIQTEARLRRGDNMNSNWKSGSIDESLSEDASNIKVSASKFSNRSKDGVEKDRLNESTESLSSAGHLSSTSTDIDFVLSSVNTDIDLKLSLEGLNQENPVAEHPRLKDPLYTHVETDIDAYDIPEIIHHKNLSTDSAVYATDEHISHIKALSNESTDSFADYSEIPYDEHFDDAGYHQESTGQEMLPCDDSEKEKPQVHHKSTINRRKKDPSAPNSRSPSCVSTDSTASTGTMDSGIACSESRASPMSNDSSYYNKNLNGSRENLDDEITRLPDLPASGHHDATSNSSYPLHGEVYGVHRSPTSSGENSRRDSLQSLRAGDLDNEKAKLVESMREKISELCDQEREIDEEIRVNEDLGKKVTSMVKLKATHVEFGKFELFLGELKKIVALLLSLTQRLHRYELMLQELDMANEDDKEKKDGLITKIDKLKGQHEEACYLRDVNDKRGEVVATFLENYCTEEEFADFQYYVDMKSQLALMQSEIREKVKLGEERLKALEKTNSEWGYK